MKKKFLETGKVVGTHGIKGTLRIQPWSDDGEFFASLKRIYFDNGESEVKILSAKPHKAIVLADIEGVCSIEDAEKLRGKIIYVRRDDVELPEGRYFIDELIGADVFDCDTEKLLGKITDVSETGANDVWHITNENGEYLVPAIKDVVVSVDIEAEKAVIRPLKGIFDDEN